MFNLRTLSIAAVAVMTLASTPSFAQDAMAPDAMAPADAIAPDAMSPMAPDAMTPMMSDDELAMCLKQAGAITFPMVMQAATDACHGMHNGMMAPDVVAPDTMAPADAMAPDAMAPAAQ